MIVEAERNTMGCFTVMPVNKRHLTKFARHMREWQGLPPWRLLLRDRGVAFLQREDDIELLFERYIPRRKHADARKGWPVRFRMDPWDYGHFLGFDAHEVRL